MPESPSLPHRQVEPADSGLPLCDTPASSVLRLVHWTSAASRHLRRRLAEIADTVSLSDTELLAVWLCDRGGRVQVELAAALGVSPAQMSGLVERLRSRGLVAMHRLAGDRRRQVWRTTAAGQVLLASAAEGLNELAAAISGTLTGDEQQAAQSLFERLAHSTTTNPRRPAAKPVAAVQHDAQLASKEAA